MNPAALLALIADLYTQVMTLKQENDELRQTLAGVEPRTAGTSP